MKELKQLYSFSVTNEDGKSTRIILARPNPRQYEDSEMEYSVKISGLVKQGVLTRAMLYKRFEDQGGLLPDNIRLEQIDNQTKLVNAQLALVRLQAKKHNNDKEKAEIQSLITTMEETRRRMIVIENAFDSVYSHTADRLTQTAMVYWWLFQLAYRQDEDEDVPTKIFTSTDYSKNKEVFHEFNEEDTKFAKAVNSRLFGLISFWYYGKDITAEDMDTFLRDYFKEDVEPEAEKVESPAEPESAPKAPKKAASKRAKAK